MEKAVRVSVSGMAILVESTDTISSPVEAMTILSLGIQALQNELMKQPKIVLPGIPGMKIPSRDN
ncbi:MAG: hypothetical protein DDT18_00605 [Actinobacteria bacterium]|nr:hypothetical protein [Actinomycetota bacterium]